MQAFLESERERLIAEGADSWLDPAPCPMPGPELLRVGSLMWRVRRHIRQLCVSPQSDELEDVARELESESAALEEEVAREVSLARGIELAATARTWQRPQEGGAR